MITSFNKCLPALKYKYRGTNKQLRTIIRDIRSTGKWWNKDVLGHLDTTITDKEKETKQNDSTNQKDSVTLRAEFDKLYQHRDNMLWQKSRTSWNAYGDKNRKYFHLIANRRRQRNSIQGIYKGNNWITQPDNIKSIFFEYFKDLLRNRQNNIAFVINTLTVNSIPENIKFNLEKPFSEAEALLALSQTDSNKSPGPDGLNAACIKRCWDKIQPNFKDTIKIFHQTGNLPHG